MHFLLWVMLVALVTRPVEAQQVVFQGVDKPSATIKTTSSPGLSEDPDSLLYVEAVNSLNNGAIKYAIGKFQKIVTEYPKSRYVPEALYWIAFAYNRIGTRDNEIEHLRNGLAALRELRNKFRKEFKRGDAPALEQRILGELARRGDTDAARAVTSRSRQVVQERGQQSDANCAMDNGGAQSNDVQIAALNALMQMGPEQALPTLQEVLGRRDQGSVCLRRATVLLVAQQRGNGAEATLLRTARTDPDLEVRKRAVLHLSQFNTERALSALDSIVHEARDSELVTTAVIALSQSNNPRAKYALLTYASRNELSKDVRRQIVLQLLQDNQLTSRTALEKVYKLLDPKDLDLRREIMTRVWGMSPFGDSAAGRWYLGIARNNAEAIAIRIEALTKGAQMIRIENRVKLYSPTLSRELREKLLEAYAENQHVRQNGNAVLDELREIAKRDPDGELRRRAVARISAAKSPRAAEILREIVTEP